MIKEVKGQTILKGAMVLAIASFLSKIIGMLYRIPLTNAIGDTGNYIYGSAFQIYTILVTLSAVGVPSAISKLVSERTAVGAYKDAHRVYKVALVYTGILSFILAVGLWFGADVIALYMTKDSPEIAMPLRALAPTIIIVAIMAVMRGYFQGLNSMTPTAVSQVIEQLFNAIFSVVLAYALIPKGIEIAAVGSTLGTGIGAVAGLMVVLFVYVLIRPHLKQRIEKSKPYHYESNRTILKKILITTIPIVLSTSVFAVITTIDNSMLTYKLPYAVQSLMDQGKITQLPITEVELQTAEQITKSLIGQYTGKYMPLINVPVSLILTLGMTATPAIAAARALQNDKDVRRKTKLILKIGILFAAPSAVGLTLFAQPIMRFIYKGVSDGGELLAYGSIAILFITIAQLSTGILQGMGKQHIPTINAFIACAIKVVLNFIFLAIPNLHIYAVIHSTTLCYLIFAVLNIKYLKQELKIKFNWINFLVKPILSAGIMGAISYAVFRLLMLISPNEKLWLLFIIPFAATIYVMAGLLTKAITKSDIESIPGGKKIVDRFF